MTKRGIWFSHFVIYFILKSVNVFPKLLTRYLRTFDKKFAQLHCLLLLTFLAVIFESTVFTRTPGLRQYQLEVFWSWKEILKIGKCGRMGSSTEGGLFQENLLNILLLLPVWFLLPGIFNRRLKWWQGLIVGMMISSAIEVSQLVLCRGLFEFDDIIHNSLGCMLGTLAGDKFCKHCRCSIGIRPR